MATTEYKPVPNWPGYYVTSTGVVTGPKGTQLKNTHHDGSYYRVQLWSKGKYKSFLVHVLVMELFGPERPSVTHQVDHLDGDGLNNSLSNFEWVTPKENSIRRSARLGGNPKARRGHLPCIKCQERPRRVYGKGTIGSLCKPCHAVEEQNRYSAKRA